FWESYSAMSVKLPPISTATAKDASTKAQPPPSPYDGLAVLTAARPKAPAFPFAESAKKRKLLSRRNARSAKAVDIAVAVERLGLGTFGAELRGRGVVDAAVGERDAIEPKSCICGH